MRLRFAFFAAFFLSVFTFGCENRQETTPAPESRLELPAKSSSPVPMPGKNPEFRIVELSSDALPTWRTFQDFNPTLVVCSNEPFLLPVPEQLRSKALELATRGTPEQLLADGRYFRSAPELLPSQAAGMALAAGLVQRVVWLVPSELPVGDIDLQVFRRQLRESGILTGDETGALERKGNTLVGTIRGMPLQIATLAELPAIDSPVLLHLDLSFFRKLYRNGVKTPVNSLAREVTGKLRDTQWPLLAATISLSTEEEGMVPMEWRYLGRVLAKLLAGTEPTAAELDRRAEGYYLEEMMQTEKAAALFRDLARQSPDDAGLLFDHYRSLRRTRKGPEALEILAKAVSLDRGYAYEYLTLSAAAEQAGNIKASLAMLEKAKPLFPLNQNITLAMIDRHLQLGNYAEAERLILELRGRNWSEIYFPDMPATIESLRDRIREAKAKDRGRQTS